MHRLKHRYFAAKNRLELWSVHIICLAIARSKNVFSSFVVWHCALNTFPTPFICSFFFQWRLSLVSQSTRYLSWLCWETMKWPYLDWKRYGRCLRPKAWGYCQHQIHNSILHGNDWSDVGWRALFGSGCPVKFDSQFSLCSYKKKKENEKVRQLKGCDAGVKCRLDSGEENLRVRGLVIAQTCRK